MPRWQTYHLAESVPDALQALAAAPGPARIIAGGSDLLLDIEQGRQKPPHTLVDVTRIPEMTVIARRDDSIFVGAAFPLQRLLTSPLLACHAQALVEACALIGGPQVRNTATLGGNVAHALPAGDGAIALLALQAQAEVANLQGRRLAPMPDLYAGPGQSTLRQGLDLLVGFHLPLAGPGQASAFQRVMRPQGVAIAILNMAVWLRRTEDHIADIRLAVGPSGPTPRRMTAAEAALRNQPLSDETFARAVDALLSEANFRTSPHRASSAYRRHLAGVLLKETTTTAMARALLTPHPLASTPP